MRPLIRAIALTALLSMPLSAQALPHNALTSKEVADGWILLFDGETDFGWKPRGDAGWTVKDGEIHGTGGNQQVGFLATTTEVADFELKAEVRVDEMTNSGIFLRCPIDGPILQDNAYEVNVFDRHPQWPTGSINGIAKTRRKVTSVGKWTRFEIKADGENLSVSVDGKNTIRKRDKKFARGPIALQFFGQGTGGTVAFRSIKLKPLGLKSIFNGRDLTGWKVIPERKSVYSVTPEGWLNVKDGNGEIQTEGRWADFVLQMDIISNGTHLNSGVFFRELPGQFWAGYESQIRNQWQGEDRTKPVDFGTGGIYNRQPARKVVSNDREWFTKTIIAAGNHLAVWVNGYQVSDFTDTRPPAANARQGTKTDAGVIGLQGHDPTTDLSFRRIRIKALPPPRQ
jgi:hypothetical protein